MSDLSHEQRVALIEQESSKLPLIQQAELLSVSRSSLYYQTRGPTSLEIATKHRIDELYTEYPFYGSRNLTDTEYGASGSPICNDDWYVVGMHRAAYEANRASYRGEVIRYHNEGIEIHAIFNHLSVEIQQEIAQHQGW